MVEESREGLLCWALLWPWPWSHDHRFYRVALPSWLQLSQRSLNTFSSSLIWSRVSTEQALSFRHCGLSLGFLNLCGLCHSPIAEVSWNAGLDSVPSRALSDELDAICFKPFYRGGAPHQISRLSRPPLTPGCLKGSEFPSRSETSGSSVGQGQIIWAHHEQVLEWRALGNNK